MYLWDGRFVYWVGSEVMKMRVFPSHTRYIWTSVLLNPVTVTSWLTFTFLYMPQEW